MIKMIKNMSQYGIVIVDQEGQEYDYVRELGKQHQEYLDLYSHQKDYPTSNRSELASRMGDAVFYIEHDLAVSFLPKDPSIEQFNTLKSLSLTMEELTDLIVRVVQEKGYRDFKFTGKNIGSHFENEVLASYQFNTTDTKRK